MGLQFFFKLHIVRLIYISSYRLGVNLGKIRLIKVTSYRGKSNENSSYRVTESLNLLPTATTGFRRTLLVYYRLDLSTLYFQMSITNLAC